ncbi:HEAT repeat domain-containing protein [Candidatus Poribacteria bacterium]|nr:HEAT repeat domain-containing protein [Candidatus Poribacteria bacterium]
MTTTVTEKICQEVKNLFKGARGQHFEDGMESAFSRDFVSLIKAHGDVAVKTIAELFFSEEVNAEVMGEALRWLGDINAPQSHSSRLKLLEQSLKSSSLYVRDGATVGIAFLDDPHAIPALKDAIQQEKLPGLREDMQQVLEQLEETFVVDTRNVSDIPFGRQD